MDGSSDRTGRAEWGWLRYDLGALFAWPVGESLAMAGDDHGEVDWREMGVAELGMRIAVGQFNELTDEKLKFAAQLGGGGVQMNTPRLPGEGKWAVEDLKALVKKCDDYGLRMEAIENVPLHFYDKAMLGLP